MAVRLVKAKNCLAGPQGGRGTAELTTWRRRAKEQLQVCPHLNIAMSLKSAGSTSERAAEMGEAMERLEPLHRFVVAACR